MDGQTVVGQVMQYSTILELDWQFTYFVPSLTDVLSFLGNHLSALLFIILFLLKFIILDIINKPIMI